MSALRDLADALASGMNHEQCKRSLIELATAAELKLQEACGFAWLAGQEIEALRAENQRLTAKRDEARSPTEGIGKLVRELHEAKAAAESALPAVREQCARLADELERTGRRMPNHACRECVPFSEILVDGFQCAYHAAIRAIPIEVKT